MKTVTKRQLADLIVKQTGFKRSTVKRVVQAVFDGIVGELSKGNRLEFRDFGVFELKKRRSRLAQNPRTLERVNVPAKWTVKFKPGNVMKNEVQNTAEQGGGREARAAEGTETTSVSTPPADRLANPSAPSL